MNTNVLNLINIKKDYGAGAGAFWINIGLKSGEIYGFIGPNGAGKSTVIRQIVGFIKSDKGQGSILGNDIWKERAEIMKDLGYLAGEMTLPEYMTGTQYLKFMAEIRGKQRVDWKYVEKLIKYFELNPKFKIKKMSKGMKQKVAIIAAFMHKPKLLILDEPTSGLDPVMQEKFNRLIMLIKKNGGTIFISSHIFGEIENTCDRVGFIKKGKMHSEISVEELRRDSNKTYVLVFANQDDFQKMIESRKWTITKQDRILKKVTVKIPKNSIMPFFHDVLTYNLVQFREVPFNLEDYFLSLYSDEIGEVNFDVS